MNMEPAIEAFIQALKQQDDGYVSDRYSDGGRVIDGYFDVEAALIPVLTEIETRTNAAIRDLQTKLLIASESGNAEAGEHEQLKQELEFVRGQLETAKHGAWKEGYAEGIIHMGMSIDDHRKQVGNPYRPSVED